VKTDSPSSGPHSFYSLAGVSVGGEGGGPSRNDGHVFSHAHASQAIPVPSIRGGSEPNRRRPPLRTTAIPRQVQSDRGLGSDVGSGADRGPRSDASGWNPQRMNEWQQQAADAPPPPVTPDALDDDIASLALGIDKRLACGPAGTVDGREMITLGKGKYGLKSITTDMHAGRGIDAIQGTLIIRVGQPAQLHVFRQYGGQWHRHGFTDGAPEPGELMKPSELLTSLRAKDRLFAADIYRACAYGENLAAEDYDPLHGPDGPLSRWFKYKAPAAA